MAKIPSSLSGISLSPEKGDLNLLFYSFLKELNSEKLNEKEIESFLLQMQKFEPNVSFKSRLELLGTVTEKLKSQKKKVLLMRFISQMKDQTTLDLFSFSLKILSIKPLLLAEAKLVETFTLVKESKKHPLSLEYDNLGKYMAYATRVNGALLSLLFFNQLESEKPAFLSGRTHLIFENLEKEAKRLKEKGLEANSIFMLMFSESMNQSITSSAGGSYEDRIQDVLIALGINREAIGKTHDDADKSMEYDFFFSLGGRTYGIGAKRTLRERYKQFIKTSHTSQIDVTITITLGLDLTAEKARTIHQHETTIFIADEVYETRPDLQEMDWVYPASALTLDTLKQL